MAKRNATNSQKIGLQLIVVGVVLVGISTTHKIVRLRTLSLGSEVTEWYVERQKQSPAAAKTDLHPAHIFIRWRVDVAIDPAIIDGGKWVTSSDHASYLVTSAPMGEKGNTIIYGHNTRAILGNIRALQIGNIVTLTAQNGTTKDYRVVELREVSPENLEYVKPTETEVITIYTCSGFMDSKRYIVRAEPFSE